MKIKIFLFFLFQCFFFQNCAIAQFNAITLNGADYYINGINLPWNNFGWDFGNHERWGDGYDPAWFEAAFTEIEERNINTVRVFLHCDGRANPEFDQDGFVMGLDEGLLDELEDFVTRANDHSLMVIITLWSFDMLENNTGPSGAFAGMHADLIRDVEKTNSYLDNALIPIVELLSDHCNILAWEIMNEPEWGMQIDNGNTTAQTVTVKEMQGFMGRCIQTIRQHSDQNITIGSALPFGNMVDHNKNYWQESEFQNLGFDCGEVYLDFYSFHFYDWMSDDESPFVNNAASWALGKPIIISESSTAVSSEISPLDQLEKSIENEYAGMVLWSYNAGDEFSDWENCSEEMSEFGSNQMNVAYDNSCDSVMIEKPLLICNIYPNPTTTHLNLSIHFPDESMSIFAEIVNAQGQSVRKLELPFMSTRLNVETLSAGFYFIHLSILDDKGELIERTAYRIVIG